MSAVRAELVKATTTWTWWGVLLIALAFAALNVGVLGALGPTSPGGPAELAALPLLTSLEGQVQLVGSGYQGGYLFAAVLGTVVGAVDFRHGTVTPTFLAVPRRGRVAAAKLAVAGLLGLGYGVAIQLASLAVAVAALALRGVALADVAGLAAPLALGALGIAVWALVGTGVGLLLRRQVAAIVLVVVVLTLVDPLAGAGLAAVGEVGGVDLAAVAGYTLTGASTAVVTGVSTAVLPPWWAGLLVLLGWAVAVTAAAWATTLRRDVT